jgi:FixJ family two-component response regulator
MTVRTMKAGAVALLTKPLGSDALPSAARQAIAGSHEISGCG